MNISVAPSWTHWEKHKHRALIALAVLASAAIASVARNERRMFVLPEEFSAFAAITAPEPTSLRSPIMGYLDEGCVPDPAAGQDCRRGRTRKPSPLIVPEPLLEGGDDTDPGPIAFFAMPDVPILIRSIEIPDIEPLVPPAQRLPFLGGILGDPPPSGPAGLSPPIPVPAGIPEPRSWAMMLAGLGIAGTVLRLFARVGRVAAR